MYPRCYPTHADLLELIDAPLPDQVSVRGGASEILQFIEISKRVC